MGECGGRAAAKRPYVKKAESTKSWLELLQYPGEVPAMAEN